jgi:hypothetical protein
MRFEELAGVDPSRTNWWEHEEQFNGGNLNP